MADNVPALARINVLCCSRCRAAGLGKFSGTYSQFLCANCGTGYEMDQSDWFYQFSARAPAQHRSLLVHMTPPRNPHMTRFAVEVICENLREVVQRLAPAVIADIGCGNGGYHPLFHGTCRAYYGLEPSLIPADRRLAAAPPESVILVHNDPAEPLPLQDCSIDMALFLASYDQIPNRIEVLQQAWQALRWGGVLLVVMTNYSFWLKRVVNVLARRKFYRHTEIHFCVHSPSSLIQEVVGALPSVRVVECRSDDMYVPNTPPSAPYSLRGVLEIANAVLRFMRDNPAEFRRFLEDAGNS